MLLRAVLSSFSLPEFIDISISYDRIHIWGKERLRTRFMDILKCRRTVLCSTNVDGIILSW